MLNDFIGKILEIPKSIKINYPFLLTIIFCGFISWCIILQLWIEDKERNNFKVKLII
jgi:hypothetical protein